MTSFYGGVSIGGSGGGTSGVGISNVEINANRNLVIYLTDGSVKNLGKVDGATFTPEIIDGVLKWSNDHGLVNPPDFDIYDVLSDISESKWISIKTGEEPPEDDTDKINYWVPIK